MTAKITGPIESLPEGTNSEANDAEGTSPEDDPSRTRTNNNHSANRHQRRSRSSTPDRAALLEMLSRMLPLVATGVMPPGQARTTLAILQTLLEQIGHQSGAAAGVDIPSLQAILRDRPDFLHVIEPILSAGELHELFEGGAPESV